ncbi:unnamed protein product, partial [Aphanomyces euteiches]
LFKGIAINECTTADIKVHHVYFRLWGLLVKFLKAPGQENFLLLVVPSFQVDLIQRTTDVASKAPSIDILGDLQSPTHPIWSQVLPQLHKFGFVFRFMHLVKLNVDKFTLTLHDAKREQAIVSINNAAISIHGCFDPEKYEVAISIKVCADQAMQVHAPQVDINAEVQGIEVKMSFPISQNAQDIRLPLPNKVCITGQHLRVMTTTAPIINISSTPLGLPISPSPVDVRTVNVFMSLLPANVSLTWNDIELSMKHQSNAMKANLRRIIINNENKPHLQAIHHRLGAEIGSITVNLVDQAHLLQIEPAICSMDITSGGAYLAAKLSCELKHVSIHLCDSLEPWISFVSKLSLPPPPPLPPFFSSFETHCKVTKLTVHILPRSSSVLDSKDPSLHCPPVEIRVEDIYASIFPHESLSTRARTELRLNRTSFWVLHDSITTASLSLDYLRMFFFPSAAVITGTSDEPAEIEMEGEWVELCYSPLLLHAIGGVFHFVMFTCQDPLKQLFATPKVSWTARVPPKRQFEAIFGRDNLYEKVNFQGVLKRVTAVFPFSLGEGASAMLEQVTMDTFSIETDATSPAFRLHMERTKVMHGPKPKPYLVLGHFAVEETPVGISSVVDLYGRDAFVTWDVMTQIRVMKVVQDVTTAVYKLLFQLFHSYTLHVAPPHSKFVVGMNLPMNDKAAYDVMDSLFPTLISASGDKLHRLAIENVHVSAPEYRLELSLHDFGGDDLPELWKFGGIEIKWRDEQLAFVDSVAVRHTVDNRPDYVFGDFEAMLRQRQKALKLTPQSLPTEGMSLAFEDIRVTLPHKCLTPLVEMSNLLQDQVALLLAALNEVLSVYWRPQQLLFYRYFLKLPEPTNPVIWVDVRHVVIEWRDDPFECWLEHMLPIWKDELVGQERRRQMADEQWNSLKLTNADLLAAGSRDAMNQSLLKKDALLYIQRLKQQRHSPKPRIQLSIAHVNGQIQPWSDEIRLIRKIKELDVATQTLLQIPKCVRPCFDILMGVSLDLTIESFSAKFRQSFTPVNIEAIKVTGDTIFAQSTSTTAMHVVQNVPLTDFKHIRITTSVMPMKAFLDLCVTVNSTTVSYNPLMNPILWELAQDAERCIPHLLPTFEVGKVPYWDILRRLVHGNIVVTCRNTAVKLLTAYTDFLLIHVDNTQVQYISRHVDVNLEKIQMKIEPHCLDMILDVPHVSLSIGLDWGNNCSHYIYPIKFTYLDLDKIIQTHVHEPDNQVNTASPHLRLTIHLDIGVCEKKNSTSVIIYGNSVEWLLDFAHWYIEKMRIPRGARYKTQPVVHLLEIQHHLKQLVVKSIEVNNGIDIAIYHSHQSPLGIRLSVHQVFASLAVTKGIVRTLADCFEHQMMSLEACNWALHDAVMRVQDIQVRICTFKTGSRGEAFLNIHQAYVEMEQTLDDLMEKAQAVRQQLHLPDQVLVADPDPAPTKSILEHFDIKDDEHLLLKACPKEDPQPSPQPIPLLSSISPLEGCLCYVLAHQQRVFVNLDTMEALVDIVDEWVQFFKGHVPSLTEVPRSVILEVESTADEATDATPVKSSGPANLLEHMLQQDIEAKLRVSSSNDFKAETPVEEHDMSEAFQTLVRIRFVDFQLSVQDTAHKGTMLVAIPSGCVEPAIELENRAEHISISVSGIFAYTSSMDVDMTTRHWLKIKPCTSAFCDSSTMLWKKVVNASSIDCVIGITHDVPKVHHIEVHIPRIDVTFDLESKQILTDMTNLFTARIMEKLEQQKLANTTREMIRHLEETTQRMPVSSLPELWYRRRAVRWKLMELRWHESCRRSVRNEGDEDRKLRLRFSSQSTPIIPPQTNATLDLIVSELNQLSDEIHHLFQEFKQHKQVHPTVELHFVLERASLCLKSPSFDILRLETQDVECTFAHYEDQSGTMTCKVHSLSAVNLMPQTPLPDLVIPVESRNIQFVDKGVIIRVDAEMAPPVGGITVVQHFEINVLPLQVCITYELVMQLYAFLSNPSTPSPSIHKQEEKVRNQFLVYTKGSSRKSRVSNASEDSMRDEELTKDAVEMTERASTNMTFKHIRLGNVLVLLTYKSGKTAVTPQHLEEMRGFELKIHSLVYTDKTCSIEDLLLRVRRDIILDILSQVGRNFNNIGVFLKERLDISRWAGFEFPLKSLSMGSSVKDTDSPLSSPNASSPQNAFSLELKPDAHPIKKAKSRFSFLKIRKKKSTEISQPEETSKSTDE